jgi:hypothetical protein
LPSTGSPLLTDCKMCTRPSTMNNATRPRECGRAHAANITIKRSQRESRVCNGIMRAPQRVCYFFATVAPRKCWSQSTTIALAHSLGSPRTDGTFLYASLFVICYSLFFRLSRFVISRNIMQEEQKKFCSGGSEVMQPVTHSDNFMPQKGTCHNTSSRRRHTPTSSKRHVLSHCAFGGAR